MINASNVEVELESNTITDLTNPDSDNPSLIDADISDGTLTLTTNTIQCQKTLYEAGSVDLSAALELDDEDTTETVIYIENGTVLSSDNTIQYCFYQRISINLIHLFKFNSNILSPFNHIYGYFWNY